MLGQEEPIPSPSSTAQGALSLTRTVAAQRPGPGSGPGASFDSKMVKDADVEMTRGGSREKETRDLSTLHLSYAWTPERHWLVGACTDAKGEILQTALVRHMFTLNSDETSCVRETIRKLWAKTVDPIASALISGHTSNL